MIIVRDGQQMGKKCCIFAADLGGELYGQNNHEQIYSNIGQYFGEREILTFGHF